MWFFGKSNKPKNEVAIEAKLSIGSPILRVLVEDTHIATIYRDGSHYCLVYTAAFESTGLAPFNSNDLARGSLPEKDKVYRSESLWASFEMRIPSPDRDDYESLLRSSGLRGDEDPLIILGSVGKISISKPWKLELVKPKAS
jgi:hypothetical protein